jgi:outer membrane murein-binding lipoprotein Lpp
MTTGANKASAVRAGLFLVAVLALAAVVVSGGRASRTRPLRTPLAALPEPRLAPDVQRIDELSQHVQALEARLAASERETARLRLQTDDANKAAPEITEADTERANQAYEDKLSRIARGESSDPAWLTEVSALLDSHLGGQAIEIASTQCGTTMCVAMLNHDTPTAHAKFFAELRRDRNAWDVFGAAFVRRHDVPGGGFRTTLFMARPTAALVRRDDLSEP